MPFHKTTQGFVVGDHAGDLDIKLFGLPAGEQVVKAMLLLGNQDDHTLALGGIGDLPGHVKFIGHRLEGRAQTIQIKR